jgi:hypothetical protein
MKLQLIPVLNKDEREQEKESKPTGQRARGMPKTFRKGDSEAKE